jgi:nitrite reductase (NADH) small subunit
MIPTEIAAAATDLASAGWVKVATVDDVPPFEGRRTTIEGRKVAVFRLSDGFAAIDAECPHKQGPLQDGLVAGDCVTCPLHDRRISLTTGLVEGHEGESVGVHEVHVDGDDLWVRLTAPSA